MRVARWRIHVEGLEHVPQRGGAVMTWNHHGHLDMVPPMWQVYRRLGRSARFLALQELWGSRLLGWLPRLVDAIPVDRSSRPARTDPLRTAVRALREGHLVLVAPEAGISTSFELLPFRPGAARMAQAAGVPIVPSASWGSHRVSTTGHRPSIRRAFGIPVVVRYGRPIEVGPDDDLLEVTQRLRDVTAALLDDLQRGYPDGTPVGAWWVPARLGGGAPPPGRERAS